MVNAVEMVKKAVDEGVDRVIDTFNKDSVTYQEITNNFVYNIPSNAFKASLIVDNENIGNTIQEEKMHNCKL